MTKVDLDKEIDNWISTRKLAKIVDLSGERIRQLEDEGIFKSRLRGRNKEYDFYPSLWAYHEYLKRGGEILSGEALNDEARKIRAEADLKEAKAAIENMRLAELKGQMHNSDDVCAVITDLVFEIRSQITALPGRLAMDTARIQTAEEESIRIRDEVNLILDSLANYRYDPEKFSKRVKARGEGADENASEETDS